MIDPVEFWARVAWSENDFVCWPWTLSLNPNGYGQVNRKNDLDFPHGIRTAHSVAFELTWGVVLPEGLVLDHLCHNQTLACPGGPTCPHRACCNPAHLGVKTVRDNFLAALEPRGLGPFASHCVAGHAFADADVLGWVRRKARRAQDDQWEKYCKRCSRIKMWDRRHPNGPAHKEAELFDPAMSRRVA